MSTPAGNALALAKLAADRRAGATALPVQRGFRREPVCCTPDPSESCPVQLDLFGDHADDGEAGR